MNSAKLASLFACTQQLRSAAVESSVSAVLPLVISLATYWSGLPQALLFPVMHRKELKREIDSVSCQLMLRVPAAT